MRYIPLSISYKAYQNAIKINQKKNKTYTQFEETEQLSEPVRYGRNVGIMIDKPGALMGKSGNRQEEKDSVDKQKF